MTAITRYVTVGLALFESIAMAIGFGRQGMIPNLNFFKGVIVVACLTAGSAMLMWLGERITEKGIGNGISIVLAVNIISRVPSDLALLYENFIKDRYLQMAKGAFLEREKPVTLRIIARYLPPKSVSKKRKLDMLEGRELPLKKPDMDNIVKVVADALNGVAYHDDTQIALVQAKKCYSAVEGLDVTVEEYAG